MPLSSAYYSASPVEPPAMYGQLRQQAQALNAPPPIPDLFARPQPGPVQQAPDGPHGPSQGDQGQQPTPQPTTAQQGSGSAQAAQAALLYHMLIGNGPQGFLGAAMPGSRPTDQRRGLAQTGQSFGLQDPSITALFDPQNLANRQQGRGIYGPRPSQMGERFRDPSRGEYQIDPAIFDNAIAYLRTLLGLGV